MLEKFNFFEKNTQNLPIGLSSPRLQGRPIRIAAGGKPSTWLTPGRPRGSSDKNHPKMMSNMPRSILE